MRFQSYLRSTLTLILISMLLGVITACNVSEKTSGQGTKTDPEQIRKMEILNQTADEMYKKTMEGQVEEARTKLLLISDQITQIRFDGVTSIEGLNALTETVTQAKRVYNAAAFSPDEGQVAVAKIRLATDALTHANQPMWLQYYKVLQNDLNELEQRTKAGKKAESLAAMGKLFQHYSVVRPSLLISRQPSDVEKMDSLFTFVKTSLNAEPAVPGNVQKGIEQLRSSIDELFMKKNEATAYLPMADPKQPILWSLGIGAIIISVLTFAGWRMFKTGSNVVPVRHKEEG